ncbi:hypothetical protein Pla100_40680 [Neorhodopirellula pilleata]|uniref:Uncharacterized protein n=1 Tax=Neorhodopirellula pilleata TaxID=2714738 RepID=A0A5C6A2I1_9BACT|nr:hypothetical protein Pla100_40680 [Neorhodopirellula pilleata]
MVHLFVNSVGTLMNQQNLMPQTLMPRRRHSVNATNDRSSGERTSELVMPEITDFEGVGEIDESSR